MNKQDAWKNCYPSNWKGLIVPEAMAHPAKYSSKLIRRIYEHMLAEGWVNAGDNILDPFGGVALGALDAMRLGLNWYGVELEKRFWMAGSGCDCPGFSIEFRRYYRKHHIDASFLCPTCTTNLLSKREFYQRQSVEDVTQDAHRYMGNIDQWNNKFGDMPRWGTAHLFNRDSRRLLEVIGGVQASVSSPPYSETRNAASGSAHNMDDMRRNYHGDGGYSRVAASVSSPPYAESIQTSEKGSGIDYSKSKTGGKGRTAGREAIATGYGRGNGQLGGMKAEQFNAAISSPPFLQSEGGTPEPKPGGAIDAALYARHAAGNKSANGYGESEGQLSGMKDGGFNAAISSPPYNPPMSQDHNGSKGGKRGTTPSEPGAFVKYGNAPGQLEGMGMEGFEAAISSPPYEGTDLGGGGGILARDETMRKTHGMALQDFNYGVDSKQLGNSTGDDFWLAARAIVEQVYLALAPGGHAVWVVKDYVKAKKIVPFSDQWRQLCEAVGFVTIHEHHAMLVHHKGTQYTLDGGTVEKKTQSKSFFRRLAEKNGSPAIDYETVFCMVKK